MQSSKKFCIYQLEAKEIFTSKGRKNDSSEHPKYAKIQKIQGASPLAPIRALPWTRWGAYSTPIPPAGFFISRLLNPNCRLLRNILTPLHISRRTAS